MKGFRKMAMAKAIIMSIKLMKVERLEPLTCRFRKLESDFLEDFGFWDSNEFGVY